MKEGTEILYLVSSHLVKFDQHIIKRFLRFKRAKMSERFNCFNRFIWPIQLFHYYCHVLESTIYSITSIDCCPEQRDGSARILVYHLYMRIKSTTFQKEKKSRIFTFSQCNFKLFLSHPSQYIKNTAIARNCSGGISILEFHQTYDRECLIGSFPKMWLNSLTYWVESTH